MFERSTCLRGVFTLPETNLAMENRPSQKEIASFQPINFQGGKLAVSFREGFSKPATVMGSNTWVFHQEFLTVKVFLYRYGLAAQLQAPSSWQSSPG